MKIYSYFVSDVLFNVESEQTADKLISMCNDFISDKKREKQEKDNESAEEKKKYQNLLKEKRAFINDLKKNQVENNDLALDISLNISLRVKASDVIESIGQHGFLQDKKTPYSITRNTAFKSTCTVAENKKLSKRQFDFIKRNAKEQVENACSEIFHLAPLEMRNSIKKAIGGMVNHSWKTKIFISKHFDRIAENNIFSVYEKGFDYLRNKFTFSPHLSTSDYVQKKFEEIKHASDLYDISDDLVEINDLVAALKEKKKELKKSAGKPKGLPATEDPAVRKEYDKLKSEFLALKKELTPFFAKPFSFNVDFTLKHNFTYNDEILDINSNYEDDEILFNIPEMEFEGKLSNKSFNVLKPVLMDLFLDNDSVNAILPEKMYKKNKELAERFKDLSYDHGNIDWDEVHEDIKN